MLEITMTGKSGKHLHATYGALNSCFDLIRSHQQSLTSRSNSASLICGMNRWPSGRVSASAYCDYWFDLHWGRSRCALLMKPNKVETAVQCSVCHV